MRLSLIIISTFCCFEAIFAANKSDSTRHDSLQLSNDIKLNNSRAFKSYHSDESWFHSGYNNAISNVIGRIGIISTSDFISQIVSSTVQLHIKLTHWRKSSS